MREILRLSETFEAINQRTTVKQDNDGFYHIDLDVVVRPKYKGTAYTNHSRKAVFGKMNSIEFNTWLMKKIHNLSCQGASKSEQEWMKEVNQVF